MNEQIKKLAEKAGMNIKTNRMNPNEYAKANTVYEGWRTQ